MWNKNYIIIYLILLFLLARLYLLFAGLENYVNPTPYGCETYIGTKVKMYIDGSIDSLYSLISGAAIGHLGSFTIEYLATVIFFYLFGPYLFSLKLAGLTFLLPTMIVWFFFVKRHIGTMAAFLTVLLFIFAPPSFITYNLTIGFHSLALFFDILALTFFFEMIRDAPRPSPKGKWLGWMWYALFGITSGFALWVDNVFAITLATCIVFWFIYDKIFFLKKTFSIFVISFLIGFSIWFYYLYIGLFRLTNCFQYVVSSQETFFYKKFLKKFVETLIYKLPYSFCFKDYFFSGVFLNYLYYVSFVVAFLGLVWFQRTQILKILSSFLPIGGQRTLCSLNQRGKTSLSAMVAQCGQTITVESFFLGYIAIFILAFSLSHFDTYVVPHWKGYRFFLPLYPFIIVTIAVGLNKLLNIRKIPVKLISCVLIFVLISMGVIGLANQTNIRDFGKGLTFKGYIYRRVQANIDDRLYNHSHYQFLGYDWTRSDKLELSTCESLTRYIDKKFWPDYYEGVGYAFGWRYGLEHVNAFNVLEKLKTTHLENKDYEKFLFYGIATYLPIKENVYKHVSIIPRIDSRFQHYFYQGLGTQLARRMDLADIDRILLLIDETNRKYCYIGIGRNLAERLAWAFADKKYYIGFDGLNKDYTPECYYGLGWGIGDLFEHDTDRYLAIMTNNVSSEYIEYCFKGLADRLHWKYCNDETNLHKMLYLIPTNYYILDGNTIMFNDKSQRKHLVKGWYSTEEWGTWSEGTESLIIINFREPKDYTMQIRATGFSVPGNQQSVRIYIDDNLLGEHTFTHPTTYFEDFEMQIPSTYIKDENQQIRFVYGFTGSQAEHGVGADLRQLAMGVSSIEFR